MNMERNNILEKLTEIFRDVLDDEEIVLSEETTADDIEGWDSLNHINIIASVEIDFDVKFEMFTYASMKKIADIINYIEAQL